MSIQHDQSHEVGLSQTLVITPAGEDHELQEIPSRPSSLEISPATPIVIPQQPPSQDEPAEPAENSSLLSSNGGAASLNPPSMQAAPVQAPVITPKQSIWRRIWRWIQKTWRNTWCPEILSCFLAIISLIAVIVTLSIHNGKPLPQWPMNITINALVAIFLVLLKAGLALPLSEGISQLKWQSIRHRPRRLFDMDDYDSASRGAWGSLQFLLKIEMGNHYLSGQDPGFWKRLFYLVRCRRENLIRYFAKFAAFVTCLAFIADPFVQQVVQYVECPRATTNFNAALSRARRYNASGGYMGYTESQIDPSMAAAITLGVYNPPEQISSLIAADCKSGNCTFPMFQTLGLCNSCNDISNTVHDQIFDSGYHNFTLVHPSTNKTTLYVGPSYYLSTSASPGYDSGEDYMFSLFVMSLQTNQDNITRPIAVQCHLYPCLRTYNSSITNNALHETLLSSKEIPSLIPAGSLYQFQLVSDRALQNGTWVDCTLSSEAGPGLEKIWRVQPNSTNPAVGEWITEWCPENCFWDFNGFTYREIRSSLVQYLDDVHIYITGAVPAGSIAAKNIWRNGQMDLASITKFTSDLADIMTATVRRTSYEGADKYVRGTALIQSTCVEVQWKWLSFPSVLTFLGCTFFALLYVGTPDGRSNRLWKSTSLAVLFCSLDDRIHQAAGAEKKRDEMFEFAKSVTVRLEEDDEGKARFVQR